MKNQGFFFFFFLPCITRFINLKIISQLIKIVHLYGFTTQFRIVQNLRIAEIN